MGKYHLININNLSTFTASNVSVDNEMKNILDNYYNADEHITEAERFVWLSQHMGLKFIEGLLGYELKLKRHDNVFQFRLPITHNRLSEMQLIRLSDNQKIRYVDSEKYNFYSIQGRITILDNENHPGFGDYESQGLLAIPIECPDEDGYIEEFISDVIFEKYYNDISQGFSNFIFSSNKIKQKYIFYPSLISISLCF